MSAADILAQAKADSITLRLVPPGRLKLAGDPAAVAKWAPILRPHKAALLALLAEHRSRWTITEADGTAWTSSFTPPATLEGVRARYPGALSVEPYQTPTQPTRKAITSSQAAVVASALDAMGEDDPDTRREILARCATDPEAMAHWLARAPDARPALYREWLAGIEEPRALVTLTDQQPRQAVAEGVVTRDTARASVLILAKVPGAIGLLAIPREKYRDFSPMAAVEALGVTH